MYPEWHKDPDPRGKVGADESYQINAITESLEEGR
jgi:hypothetical protein